jgi:hypothetical protein
MGLSGQVHWHGEFVTSKIPTFMAVEDALHHAAHTNRNLFNSLTLYSWSTNTLVIEENGQYHFGFSAHILMPLVGGIVAR